MRGVGRAATEQSAQVDSALKPRPGISVTVGGLVHRTQQYRIPHICLMTNPFLPPPPFGFGRCAYARVLCGIPVVIVRVRETLPPLVSRFM